MSLVGAMPGRKDRGRGRKHTGWINLIPEVFGLISVCIYSICQSIWIENTDTQNWELSVHSVARKQRIPGPTAEDELSSLGFR